MFGSISPRWPLETPPKDWTAAGSFGARRPTSADFTRRHQGVDLYAPEGAAVLACEDGTVVAVQGWSGPGTKAVLVESDGVLILYGAVAPNSYPAIGTKVRRGEKIATIGVYPHGSTMLHLECWAPGVRPPRPSWSAGGQQPAKLYNAEEYLERCRSSTGPANPPDDAPSLGTVGFFGLALTAIGLGFLVRRPRR